MSEATEITTATFDYSQVHEGTRQTVRDRAKEIRKSYASTEGNIRAIGDKLLDAKDRLQHGQFELWLASELPEISRTVAWRFMQIGALKSSESELFTLPKDTLAALAAPNVPESARAEIIERVRSGDEPKASEVRFIIQHHKGETPVTSEQKQAAKIQAEAVREERRIQAAADKIINDHNKAIERANKVQERDRLARERAIEMSSDGMPDETTSEPDLQPTGANFRQSAPKVHNNGTTAVADERGEECIAVCDGVKFNAFPHRLLIDLLAAIDSGSATLIGEVRAKFEII